MTAADRLVSAGWVRHGAFWSPPGSTSKFTLAGAVAQLAAVTTRGVRPDPTWKKSAIVDWLDQAGQTVDPTATKAQLLEAVTAVR